MEKIEKLELKHLCGYLPHGLKTDKGELWAMCRDELVKTKITNRGIVKWKIEEIKPLLLPLSALTEPLEDGSVPAIKLAELLIEKGIKQDIAPTMPFTAKIVNKPFGKLLKVTKCDEWYLMLSFENPERVQHIIFEKLLKWHFDIYGLIPAGLAIDKRTVKI